MHNLRFGGQASIRVNDGAWTDVFNHTVEVSEPERGQGGIGAVNATIRFQIPLSPGDVTVGAMNTVSIRFNGSNGVVSGIRVIALNFRDASGDDLIPANSFTQEDPDGWTPPMNNSTDINEGAYLWANAALIDDPINQRSIMGTCASCHFADGSDLKYFNYSSDSIVTRSRFHGLTKEEGERIASYILSLTNENPGRPWNPPFQPGPDLDPDPTDTPAEIGTKAENWLAGAGIEWVVDEEAEIYDHVFPNGATRAEVAKIMDHRGTYSVREIPIPLQFPDWNAWLPVFAPEDCWSEPALYTVPYSLYATLKNTVETQGGAALAAQGELNETFKDFKKDLEDWYGTFRLPDQDLANDTDVSVARNPGLSREDVIKSLMRWMVVKMIEVTRDNDLESIQDSASAMAAKGHTMFAPELLSVPGGNNRSIVFGLAPHISGNIYEHFERQPENRGKMESNQWYHLQLLMNSGYRMKVNMNVPLDWAYQIIHLESAGKRAGRTYGFQRLITQIKMLQIRETGKGVQQGGFSQRTLNPCFFYSTPERDRSHLKGVLDSVEPGLWKKVFEEYLYEWLDVLQGHDLATMPRNNTDRHQLETASYVPVPWPGGDDKFFDRPNEVHADALYRLIPLLPADDIDELLLEDILAWCELAWPYDAGTWGGVPAWDTLVTPKAIYAENFEDGASDFSGLSTLVIKDANYVNDNGNTPANGGGRYVAQRGLTGGASRQALNTNAMVNVSGETRVRWKARLAFRDNDEVDPGVVNFKFRFQVDGSATIYDSETVEIDPALYGYKFQSFESETAVPAGATNITWISAYWEREGGSGGGTVYIDNIHIVPVDETVDVTPPSAPELSNVRDRAGLRMKITWEETNPPSDGVVGYNVYRRVDGELESEAIKINEGLVDNPYIVFEDYTIERGVKYHYHITAVDAAGNESRPSNSKSRTLDDTDTPYASSTTWADDHSGALRVGWFGVNDWDAAAYKVYRSGAGQDDYSLLTPSGSEPGANFFSDTDATPGVDYDYYVLTVDGGGKTSAPSPVVTARLSHHTVWSYSFQGGNGWDSDDAAISAPELDYDEDGVPTLWEYLQGGDPTTNEGLLDGGATLLTMVEEGGETFMEMSYRRLENLPPEIIVSVSYSEDLTTWSDEYVVEGAAPATELSIVEGSAESGTRLVRVRLAAPIGMDPRFARFSVARPE